MAKKKNGADGYTPMMQHYLELKKEYQDAILFYRLGDFYEMFFEDAATASEELDLTLTGRDCGQEERAPMCGVPFHSCEAYIARLVSKGYKVAICEQVEDPKEAKGLVRREVVRMITPGTVMESSMLDEGRNNYICSLYRGKNTAGICMADISTGETYATMLEGEELSQKIFSELSRFMPAEIIMNGKAGEDVPLCRFAENRLGIRPTVLEEEKFSYAEGAASAMRQFKAENLDALGIGHAECIVCAVGALLDYLHTTQKSDLSHLRTLNVYQEGQFMELDTSARKNLELCETLRGREKKGSLLWVLDRTRTAMGSRLLRRWIEKPLIDVSQIVLRQQACAELMDDPVVRGEVSQTMRGVLDLERLTSRVVCGTANARDLRAIGSTIGKIPSVREAASRLSSPMMKEIAGLMDPLDDLAALLARAIVDEPPVSVREGGLIRDGYDEELDRLREMMTGSRGLIGAVEARERSRTGIKGLKIRYNRVFGYYIEVTKSYYHLVPEDYIRKQTLVNCERYITEELKNLEAQVLSASDRSVALEYQLFCSLRNTIMEQSYRLQQTAQALARLDVLCALAEVGAEENYVIPEVDRSGRIFIEDGRHPVVEKMRPGELFVANGVEMDKDENRMLIVTGPNMAGKSTYMRQVALIVLMAQMGAPVPARAAHIGVCDRLFTRVGASDDLSAGQSTFMVEMSEVASILRHATPESLLILDEIGRGTSTFDGMAIARAVLEYAADKGELGAKTLFATHYHELTALEGVVDGVKNYNIAVKKRGEDITFLRKIVRGCADDSYGIEVAKLAGIPETVIRKARSVLDSLENGGLTEERKPEADRASSEERDRDGQSETARRWMEEIKKLDINILTPIEAMNILYQMKKQTEALQ